MNRVVGRYGLFAIWLLLAAACPTFAEQAKLATSGDFRPFEGEFHYVYGMNDRGDVVGEGLFEKSTFPTPTVTQEGYCWPFSGGTSYLGKLPGGGDVARANALSANGSVVVGSAVHGVPRAVRRVSGTLHLLEPIGDDSFASSAEGISGNGLVIVGYSEKWTASPRAFRWTSEAEGLVQLGSLAGETGTSRAKAASNDGSVIVGETEVVGGATHAFRWTASGMVDLGTVGGAAGDSRALGMTADGAFVVGESATPEGATRAFLYTEGGTMVALPTLDDHPGNSYALSVSADGKTIAGASASDAFPDGEACVWFDGVPVAMRDMLANRYGLYLGSFAQFKDARCSSDGLKFAGNSTYHEPPPFGGDPMEAAYRVIVDPNLQPPLIESDVTEGSIQHARVGETVRYTFRFSDPDVGGTISISGWSYQGKPTLTPPIGTKSSEPIDAVFEYTPSSTSYGQLNSYSIRCTDKFGTVMRRNFKIQIAPNERPTAAPIEPQVVECENGVHTVKLSTIVHDAENAPLLVKWLVDGELIEEQDGVVSGTTLDFEHDFEHGVHDVEFRVWDRWNMPSTSVFATVTVQDTSAPIVIVTNDVTKSTDPGVDYATIVELPAPKASDASGHAIVSLEHDGTGIYPHGETVVTWKATDEFGNVGTAIQKVTVIDKEKPSAPAAGNLRFNVDPGKMFSTAKLPVPSASDNVTDASRLKITHNAPKRFPVGRTRVTFRATDEAGNFSQRTIDVVVVNRKPKSNAGRDIVVTTRSERGANVTLNGSASSDPDRQALRYKWSASGVSLKGATSAKATGRFPVGTRMAKLVVTDAGGLKSTDTVRVIVRLTNGKRRPRGSDANRSFVAATRQASQAVAEKGSRSGAALSGLAYANAAAAYGDSAGEFVRWEEGQSETDALLAYAELRAVQRLYGQAAANALLAAYAETGDESLLTAYGYAAYGTAYAAADLSER